MDDKFELLATDPVHPGRDSEDVKHLGIDLRLELASRVMASMMGRPAWNLARAVNAPVRLPALAELSVAAADALLVAWAKRGGLL